MLKDESHIVRFSLLCLQHMHDYCGRLDTIGLAGFSHNFGALEGKKASVTAMFDSMGASPRTSPISKNLILFGHTFPFIVWIPTPRLKFTQKLNITMEEISKVLLARTQKELDMGMIGGKEERSIIGSLST